MKIKITPANITKLKKNDVFVFGSNLNGNHAGGAAKYALDNFGAENGNPEGIQGQSYALPTLDNNMRKISLQALQVHIDNFSKVTTENPNLNFLLTDVGCGIAGFTAEEVAPLFKGLYDVNPKNISFPQSFIDILTPTVIHGFKGFNQDMTCRDFQYELGKEYEMEGHIEACDRGFHFCEHPLNVFGYYAPATSRYASVEGSGKIDKEEGGDTKVAVSKLKIGVELSFKALVEAAIKFTFDRAIWSKDEKHHATGDQGAASATGDQGAASATGDQGAASATGSRGAASATGDQGAASATGSRGAASATGDQGAASATGSRGAASATGYQGAASATGYQGAASATGYQGAASATGDQGAASATGYQGAASATGDQGAASATGSRGAASATGDQGAASATGYQGAASATGYQGAASATGDQGAAVSLGVYGKAKAALGGFIIVAEWEQDINWNWQRIDVKSARVDGQTIKADTYYMLKCGQFVEVN